MLLSASVKSSQSLLMAAMLVFAVGCVKQTVETEEMSQPKPPAPMVTKKQPPKRPEDCKIRLSRFRRRIAVASTPPSSARRPSLKALVVHFDFDKSDIRPDMRAALDAKARFLQEFPSIRVQVEGHCDERGTVEYNIALGHRRSQSSRDYLVSLGVKPSRIDTVSYGEERPADSRSNEAGWAKNRRAKFNVIGGIPAGMN